MKQRDDEINIEVFWLALLKGKFIIALITILFTVFAILFILTTTHSYKTDASLQLKKDSISSTLLEDDLSELLKSSNYTYVETQKESLLSRKVLGQVVKELGLDTDIKPKYFPFFGKRIAFKYNENFNNTVAEPQFGLEKYAWGGEKAIVEVFEVPSALLNKQFKLIVEPGNEYTLFFKKQAILTAKIGETAVITQNGSKITIKINTLQARPKTEFILQKKDIYTAIDTLREALKVTEKTEEILQISLKGQYPEKIADIVNMVIEKYKIQNIINQQEEIKAMLSFISQQLPEAKEELNKAEADFHQYQQQYNSINVDLETRALLDQISQIEQEISALELSLLDYNKKYTSSHHNIISIKQKINALEAEKIKYNKILEDLPEIQLNTIRLKQQLDNAREVHTLLLQKHNELSIAKAGITSNFYIIDKAHIPIQYIKSKNLLLLIFAIFAGLFWGVVLALLYGNMENNFYSLEDIENKFNLPVYCAIPHASELKKHKAPFCQTEQHKDIIFEYLKQCFTKLQLSLLQNKNNIKITITSPLANEGKSFFTRYLACTIAQYGKKVLLIDADIHKGKTHEFLNLDNTIGLTHVFLQQQSIQEAIQTTTLENLSVITKGDRKAAHVLNHQNAQNIFTNALQHKDLSDFDVILIDTPPLNIMSDSYFLSSISDSIFLLVDFQKTKTQDIQFALKTIQQLNLTVQGLVVNNFNEIKRYGYSYYYKKYTRE